VFGVLLIGMERNYYNSKRNHPKDIETKDISSFPISLSTTKRTRNFSFFEKEKIKSSGLMALIVLIKVVFLKLSKNLNLKTFTKIKTFELCDVDPNGADENYDDKKILKYLLTEKLLCFILI
jgi:hypothetical protein